jgi:hypothetical protein
VNFDLTKLEKNIGTRSRIVRLILGFVLAGISLYRHEPWSIIGIIIGLILIFEGAYGWCIYNHIRGMKDKSN